MQQRHLQNVQNVERWIHTFFSISSISNEECLCELWQRNNLNSFSFFFKNQVRFWWGGVINMLTREARCKVSASKMLSCLYCIILSLVRLNWFNAFFTDRKMEFDTEYSNSVIWPIYSTRVYLFRSETPVNYEIPFLLWLEMQQTSFYGNMCANITRYFQVKIMGNCSPFLQNMWSTHLMWSTFSVSYFTDQKKKTFSEHMSYCSVKSVGF